MEKIMLPAILVSLLLSGCYGKPPPKNVPHEVRAATALAELADSDTEVFPLSNGNAYLINNIDQQLFLLSGSQAERIPNADLDGFDASIYTLPNGSAYLVSSKGTKLRLYYLVGNKATLVQESAIPPEAMQGTTGTREAYLWAQNQAILARQHHAKAAAELDVDPQEPGDERD